MPRLLRGTLVVLFFVVLTLVMTWPQALVLQTRAFEHFDVFFNLWRLRWIQHALASSPRDLFNGNQFYPEPGVLAYSDAILVQGVVAAPLFAAGLKPVLVHNLVLLGGMAGSGAAMFLLAHSLSGSVAGSVLAGVVFAFAPYRFGHMMHMEMQWAMWMPLAFWALQRTLDTAKVRFGLLTGLFVVLQLLSCIYYTFFLGLALVVVGGLQLLDTPRERRGRAAAALAAGAVLAAVLSMPYVGPYRRAAAQVGTRSADEVAMWSATLTSYRAVSESNYLYRNAPQGRDEKALFPGLIPVTLGIVALVTVRPARRVWPYLLGMLLAVDLSLGANGLLYPWLYEHLGVFRALRVPARASVLVLLFLGVLAAHGAPAALSKLSPRWREAAATGLVALLLLEYWVAPLRLINYANEPPPLYRFLASQPDGVVAHLPMPSHYRMAGYEPRYIYGSTFHWKPLVNGYSGYHPSSYRDRIEALRDFPSAAAVARLRSDRVRYVVIHEGNYEKAEDAAAALAGLERIGALPLTRLNDGYSAASVFELR